MIPLNYTLPLIMLRLFLPETEAEPSPFVVRATKGGSADRHGFSTTASSIQRATSPTNEELSSDSDSSSMSDSDVLPSGKKDSYSNKGGVLFGVRHIKMFYLKYSIVFFPIASTKS